MVARDWMATRTTGRWSQRERASERANEALLSGPLSDNGMNTALLNSVQGHYVVARGMYIRKTQDMHARLPEVNNTLTRVSLAESDVASVDEVFRRGYKEATC